ncbi:aminopeptidase N-like [Arctopsyche grandis]|uniref:aminopeptidase N-like n=1 Tax=Arctopsyche grandis TaxID=121162 RepID=UPI00406D68B0
MWKHCLCFVTFLVIFGSSSAYRLPKSIAPEHYDLKVLTYLDPKENFTFEGSVLIQLNALDDTKAITLHSHNLKISESEILVKGVDKKPESFIVTNVTYDTDKDFLTIHLDKPLKKGSKYELTVPFKGALESLLGYYRSSYTNTKTGEKEWLAVTQFEAINARRAFPCFDEPAMKATYSIILGRQEGFVSISNMPLLESKPIDNMKNWYWDIFEKSVPMSTYLVAYMVSKFKYIESPKTDSNAVFKIWAREGAINQTQYASEVGPKVLSLYEKYFDLPYPLPKQDMIAVPDFQAGAMENWGLITYRETALLYTPNVSSTSSKYRVASVIAHELAHQWFGNLVTMKWWTDLWLNEGFATYVSTLGVDHLHPEWNVVMEEAVDNMLDVFRLDSLNTSHPISVPIGHANEIEQIFDVISYKKGSTIIRMMNIFLGEEVFRNGVNSYLKKYKYKNAEQDDLWESLTEAAHSAKVFPDDMTVKQIMDSWTTQTGYPVITVKRNYDKNSAEVCQEHYQSRKNVDKPSTQKWWVPLSFFNSESTVIESVPSQWLKAEESTKIEDIAEKDSWVIFNVNMSGLYKVNYDNDNWELLIKSLNGPDYKKIPTLNRVQLLIDCMDLAWTGQLKYDLALKVIQYITTEDDYLPWRGAITGLSRLTGILKNTPDYGLFKKYMRKLLTPAFKKIGGLNTKVIATPERLDAVKHQITISRWSCSMGVPDCKEHAIDLFKTWMNQSNPDEQNEIPTDLRSQVYCTGVSQGGETEWEFIWQRYLKANIASEKETLLRSLACVKETWLLKRYLLWSINEESGIKQQDSSSVFDAVASSDIGFYVAKSFLYDKTSIIRKYHKDIPAVMGRYAKSIASQISTHQELKEFSTWIENNKDDLKEGSIAIKQGLESISIRLEWSQNNLNAVVDVLKRLTSE